ncbi:hypothetical protein ACVWZB_000526 [Paenibacillus polymyxa]
MRQDLQQRYIDYFIDGRGEMNSTIAGEMLDSISSELDEFAEERSVKLRAYIDRESRRIEAEETRQFQHLAAAEEYRDITEKWLGAGARWREIGSTLTVWEYKGDRFFQWFSGVDALEHVEAARKADEALSALIKEAA